MRLELCQVQTEELKQYKLYMQEAFQKGFENKYGKTDQMVLPEKVIDRSLNAEGAAVYKAVADGEMAGGAVVVINGLFLRRICKKRDISHVGLHNFFPSLQAVPTRWPRLTYPVPKGSYRIIHV